MFNPCFKDSTGVASLLFWKSTGLFRTWILHVLNVLPRIFRATHISVPLKSFMNSRDTAVEHLWRLENLIFPVQKWPWDTSSPHADWYHWGRWMISRHKKRQLGSVNGTTYPSYPSCNGNMHAGHQRGECVVSCCCSFDGYLFSASWDVMSCHRCHSSNAGFCHSAVFFGFMTCGSSCFILGLSLALYMWQHNLHRWLTATHVEDIPLLIQMFLQLYI